MGKGGNLVVLVLISQLLLQFTSANINDGHCDTLPQQVRISLAGEGYIRVSWVTTYKMATSVVEYGTQSGKYNYYVVGDNFSYHYYSYVSGKIHYVTIPVKTDTTYYYRVGGSGPEYVFKTPPAGFPTEIVVVGGLGQSESAKATLSHINSRCYDVLLLAGGLSYAHGQQPLWDSFGRFIEPHASRRPWMVTASIHEVESVCTLVPSGPEPYKAFNARWLMPYHESGSTSNLYYSFDVAGAHIVMLGSYADYGVGSAQYEWAKADLTNVDRAKTPWVIVVVNTPWYTSNVAYRGEGEFMRKAMENLLYIARVDVVFSSRVNAYERFERVYDSTPDTCAPVYITLGDAGNKPAFDFEVSTPPTSVHRELSLGHGRLKIYDNNKAHFAWYRTQDSDGTPSDEVWLTSLISSNKCMEQCLCKKFTLTKTHTNVAHDEL